ncbi:MAG: hypothetical protein EBZ78_04815 [Verrucomicrobia bacterium]|nr:hypothetical protein [Verrucomicrobiota bacterium]
MSGVHEDTVRNAVELLEAIGVVRVTRNYDVRRKQYSENYYTLLLTGGGGGDGNFRGGVIESEAAIKSVALSKEKDEASKCPPLTLRHFDASHIKDKEAAMAAKREAAAKYKTEQLAAEEERQRQQQAAMEEHKRREAEELAARHERWRQADEKRKADQEAAKKAEDARRLAMRTDVGSCMAAIKQATFDEHDPGTLATVWVDYDHSTFNEAASRLRSDMFDKIRALRKNCPWEFETAVG